MSFAIPSQKHTAETVTWLTTLSFLKHSPFGCHETILTWCSPTTLASLFKLISHILHPLPNFLMLEFLRAWSLGLFSTCSPQVVSFIPKTSIKINNMMTSKFTVSTQTYILSSRSVSPMDYLVYLPHKHSNSTCSKPDSGSYPTSCSI